MTERQEAYAARMRAGLTRTLRGDSAKREQAERIRFANRKDFRGKFWQVEPEPLSGMGCAAAAMEQEFGGDRDGLSSIRVSPARINTETPRKR